MHHFLFHDVFLINNSPMEEKKVYSETERNWAMLCHLLAFAGYIFPFGGGVLVPLIFWLSRKDDSEWVNVNGKASINFQISILLYIVLCIPLMFIRAGFVLIPIFLAIELICVVVASIKAAQGLAFRYPLSIPFIQ